MKLPQLTAAQPNKSGVTAGAQQPQISSPVSAIIRLSFGGVSVFDCRSVVGFRVATPDTNAAEGDTQVVQWVNVCYTVYGKSSGALIAGPFSGTKLLDRLRVHRARPTMMRRNHAMGQKNHRWMASQNVFACPPYSTCVAVSQNADAMGSYNRYVFPQPGFPGYPLGMRG